MKLIVLIPVYKVFNEINCFEKKSIQQSVSKMKHEVAFIGPKRIKLSFENHFKKIRFFTFQDFYFQNIKGYNKLLKSLHFYNRFSDYSHILIAQTDAWIFGSKNELQRFTKYDYCGAISFNEDGANGYNGGLSLRNVQSSIRALKSFRNYESPSEIWKRHFPPQKKQLKPHKVFSFLLDFFIKKKVHHRFNFFTKCNEDLFWSVLIPKAVTNFNVITPEDAVKFSWEHNCQDLIKDNHLPFGCHGWWNYNLDFWQDIIIYETQIEN